MDLGWYTLKSVRKGNPCLISLRLTLTNVATPGRLVHIIIDQIWACTCARYYSQTDKNDSPMISHFLRSLAPCRHLMMIIIILLKETHKNSLHKAVKILRPTQTGVG